MVPVERGPGVLEERADDLRRVAGGRQRAGEQIGERLHDPRPEECFRSLRDALLCQSVLLGVLEERRRSPRPTRRRPRSRRLRPEAALTDPVAERVTSRHHRREGAPRSSRAASYETRSASRPCRNAPRRPNRRRGGTAARSAYGTQVEVEVDLRVEHAKLTRQVDGRLRHRHLRDPRRWGGGRRGTRGRTSSRRFASSATARIGVSGSSQFQTPPPQSRTRLSWSIPGRTPLIARRLGVRWRLGSMPNGTTATRRRAAGRPCTRRIRSGRDC